MSSAIGDGGRPRYLLTGALLLLCAAPHATAQRVADIAPGTLVRIVTQQGATVEGPLAEVRADSAYLSSTVRQSTRTIPLSNIAQFQYSDGEESHAGAGALIGGALGLALCFALNRDKDQWVSCNTTSSRASMFFLGAFPGVLIGNAVKSPRWRSGTPP